jgi:enamine deaminase RidA (YjgF/YER057c/UK114 family)
MKNMANAFNARGLPEPFGIFSSGAWATDGRPLFISGQVAQGSDGKVVGEGDIKAQTRAVLDNVGRILQQAGGTFDDIALVNVYVLDMAHLKAIHEVRAEYFQPPYPASTLVQVTRLTDPRYLIEINAIAFIKQDPPSAETAIDIAEGD